MSEHLVVREDKFFVIGEMTFLTVASLWEASQKLFPEQNTWHCNFSEVTNSDSAGLALLLAWMKQAREQKKLLQYAKLPLQLRAIAKAAGLDELLAAICVN